MTRCSSTCLLKKGVAVVSKPLSIFATGLNDEDISSLNGKMAIIH